MRAVDPGLCGSCEHARIVENRRGSRFFLCRLAEVDARYPRYPSLPVLRCRGYRPRQGGAGPGAGEGGAGQGE